MLTTICNLLCKYTTTCLIFSLCSTGVSPPKANLLKMSDVYDEMTGKPKHEVLKDHFSREGRLEESVALRIIKGGNPCPHVHVHHHVCNIIILCMYCLFYYVVVNLLESAHGNLSWPFYLFLVVAFGIWCIFVRMLLIIDMLLLSSVFSCLALSLAKGCLLVHPVLLIQQGTHNVPQPVLLNIQIISLCLQLVDMLSLLCTARVTFSRVHVPVPHV